MSKTIPIRPRGRRKPHNYYSIPKSSETGLRLKAFLAFCVDAEEQARLFADGVGADAWIESAEGMAGGCSALIFGHPTSDIERYFNRAVPEQNIYVPIPDSQIEAKMFALPVVYETQLFSILQLQPYRNASGRILPMTFGNKTPVLFLFEENYYIDVPYTSASVDATSLDADDFMRCHNKVASLHGA